MTTIGFSLPEATDVRLDVFNLLGQHVSTLVDGLLDAGRHEVIWDSRDAQGNATASGVYFYRLRAGDRTQTRKMVLLK